jgi:hypothetical protein
MRKLGRIKHAVRCRYGVGRVRVDALHPSRNPQRVGRRGCSPSRASPKYGFHAAGSFQRGFRPVFFLPVFSSFRGPSAELGVFPGSSVGCVRGSRSPSAHPGVRPGSIIGVVFGCGFFMVVPFPRRSASPEVHEWKLVYAGQGRNGCAKAIGRPTSGSHPPFALPCPSTPPPSS